MLKVLLLWFALQGSGAQWTTAASYIGSPLVYAGSGKASWFGGPNDTDTQGKERLALAKGRVRDLDPNDFYCAMRWNYKKISPKTLKNALVLIKTDDRMVVTKIVDWGPARWTGKLIDLSPAAYKELELTGKEKVKVYILLPGAKK